MDKNVRIHFEEIEDLIDVINVDEATGELHIIFKDNQTELDVKRLKDFFKEIYSQT